MALKVRSVSRDANGQLRLVVTSPQRWKNNRNARPDAQPKALLKLERKDAASTAVNISSAA